MNVKPTVIRQRFKSSRRLSMILLVSPWHVRAAWMRLIPNAPTASCCNCAVLSNIRMWIMIWLGVSLFHSLCQLQPTPSNFRHRPNHLCVASDSSAVFTGNVHDWPCGGTQADSLQAWCAVPSPLSCSRTIAKLVLAIMIMRCSAEERLTVQVHPDT